MENNLRSHPTYNGTTPISACSVAGLALRIARRVLYLVMLFFRIPLRMICNLTVAPLMVSAIAWALLAGWTSTAALMLAATSFGVFIISYFYDTLLLLVAPEPLYLDM